MNIRKVKLPIFLNLKSEKAKTLSEPLKFLLVGNPNTGKTTLFNSLSRSNEHVGNWHGVTVSEKEKEFIVDGQKQILVDLPGLYSLTPLSYEEEVATEFIFKNYSYPIINICDINNLKRNLFLTMQLKEVSNEIILFINTFSNKKNSNSLKAKIDETDLILKKLNIKYFIGNAENKKDIIEFKKYLKNLKINQNKDIKKIKEKYEKNKNNDFLNQNKNIYLKINSLFNSRKEKTSAYGTSKLDKIFLNKYLALPIFFSILFLIFYLTFFSLGSALSDVLRNFIQNTVGGSVVEWLKRVCEISWVIDLVETGIFGGVGSLLAFLPQVILLFFFLSLIEDSGYLSRVAFLFEDVFAKVGLSGKSVYSLLMGFGCSTTAALTARNMEDKNAKIKTAILTPYMSCSAKLPIYAVIGGAFFGASNVFIVFGLYLLGAVIAILLSLFLEQKILKSEKQSFILEFPAYRIPSFKRIFKILWENFKLFLIRIGTLIFSLNLIVWFFQSFSFNFRFVKTEGGQSILQTFGSLIAPVFHPLGFGSWGAASALVAGLVAKEIIVSSIAMFNGVDVMGDSVKSQTMRSILDPLSVVYFTPASAISFMVFCLLYSPCVATISVFKKEIGTKWTVISIITQFCIAYVTSFVTFNLYRLVERLGAINTLFIFSAIILFIICVAFVIFKVKNRNFCTYCKNKNNCNNCKKK